MCYGWDIGFGGDGRDQGAASVAVEQTLVIIKPDAVQRGLIGEIIGRLEKRGLKIIGMELRMIDRATAERHYAEHHGKPFYEGLVRFITSGPVVTMVLEGPNAVELSRLTMGKTKPEEATPGTIRGDFALTMGNNLIHGSDSIESGERERDLYFPPDRLVSYGRSLDDWLIANY